MYMLSKNMGGLVHEVVFKVIDVNVILTMSVYVDARELTNMGMDSQLGSNRQEARDHYKQLLADGYTAPVQFI